MFSFGINDHHVFQRGTLLTDFQLAVPVGTFEIQVGGFAVFLLRCVVEADLFGDE